MLCTQMLHNLSLAIPLKILREHILRGRSDNFTLILLISRKITSNLKEVISDLDVVNYADCLLLVLLLVLPSSC